MPPRTYCRKTAKKKAPKKSVIRKEVKSVIKSMAELKLHDITATTATPIYSNSNLISLCDIAEGTSQDDRIGSHIYLKKLKMRFTMYANAATRSTVRVAIIKAKDRVASVNSNSIWDASTDGSVFYPIANINSDPTQRARFVHLFSRRYDLGDGAVETRTFDIDLKLNFKCMYAASTAGTDRENGLWLAIFSDVPLAGAPSVHYTGRLEYYDM